MAKTTVPTHLGIILDGNRRWAKDHGLPSFAGHKKGTEVFQKISRAAFDRGVKFVSAYVFSTENWQRAEEEVNFIMKLVVSAADQYLEELHQEGIKILILGRREGVRASVLKVIKEAEEKTKNNTRGTLAFCFNYGGMQEIVDAAKKLVHDKVPEDSINEETFAGALYYPEVPPVDLVVRTSGEQRISNFMLWRVAYAEFIFTQKHWPDFSVGDLDSALQEYSKRQRRLGT